MTLSLNVSKILKKMSNYGASKMKVDNKIFDNFRKKFQNLKRIFWKYIDKNPKFDSKKMEICTYNLVILTGLGA